MNGEIMLLFFVVFLLYLIQAAGGLYQISNYKATIRKLHKLGNVGIGQKKGRLCNSNIVIISCDKEGKITAVEILDGVTLISKFHPVNLLLNEPVVGQSIYSLLNKLTGDKSTNKYRAYLSALNALKMKIEKSSS